MKEIIINNLKELEFFSKLLADHSFGGMFLGLKGDLGAGKTQFTKFFVKNLGGDIEEVVSPTFTILNEYNSEKFKIYHFDLYRLNTIEELEEIGYREFFFDEHAITIVEWIDRIPECIPENHLILNFYYINNNNEKRKIVFSWNGEKYSFIKKILRELSWH